MHFYATTILLIASIGYLLWGFDPAMPDISSHRPDDPATVKRGEIIYQSKCASCHGRSLEGGIVLNRRRRSYAKLGPAHDQSGHTWQHSHRQIFDAIKYGTRPKPGSHFQSRMPGFRWVLSDEEIWVVLSYLESSWPKKLREHHDKQDKNQNEHSH